jgi:hypothetical protein
MVAIVLAIPCLILLGFLISEIVKPSPPVNLPSDAGATTNYPSR